MEGEGCFSDSQRPCSLLAGFPMPAYLCRHRKARLVLPAWPTSTRVLHPMPLFLLQEELAHQLDALQTRTKETLLSALPEVTVSQQVGSYHSSPLTESLPCRNDRHLNVFFSFPLLVLFFKLRIMRHGYKSLRRRLWTC